MLTRDGMNRLAPCGAGLLAAALLAACFLPALAPAQVAPATWRAAGIQPALTTSYTATFSEEDLEFGSLQGYDTRVITL